MLLLLLFFFVRLFSFWTYPRYFLLGAAIRNIRESFWRWRLVVFSALKLLTGRQKRHPAFLPVILLPHQFLKFHCLETLEKCGSKPPAIGFGSHLLWAHQSGQFPMGFRAWWTYTGILLEYVLIYHPVVENIDTSTKHQLHLGVILDLRALP